MTTAPDNTGRMQGGQFAPGTSGNPAGKPRGTPHKATRVALALLSGEAEGLARKAVELALAGDLPHGLDLPRREIKSRLGFTVAACPRPEAKAPLTVTLGALWGLPRVYQ